MKKKIMPKIVNKKRQKNLKNVLTKKTGYSIMTIVPRNIYGTKVKSTLKSKQ